MGKCVCLVFLCLASGAPIVSFRLCLRLSLSEAKRQTEGGNQPFLKIKPIDKAKLQRC